MRPLLQALALAGLLGTGTVPAAPAAGEPGWDALLRVESARDQVALAARFEHGEGVDRDLGKAVFLYCRAARSGSVDAQYALGWIYANGRAGLKDEGLAAAWLSAAADAGDAHAARLLRRLPARDGTADRPRCAYPEGVSPLALLDSDGVPSREAIRLAVHALAPEYDLNPELVLAVIETESDFQARAVSHKGAIGLMQLIPATARRFGVSDPFDPVQNLRGGMQYLRWLLDRFEGRLQLALAGYNAGENAVERYGGIPPYRETRQYVQRITARYAG